MSNQNKSEDQTIKHAEEMAAEYSKRVYRMLDSRVFDAYVAGYLQAREDDQEDFSPAIPA